VSVGIWLAVVVLAFPLVPGTSGSPAACRRARGTSSSGSAGESTRAPRQPSRT